MKLNANEKTDKEFMDAGSHDLYNLLVDLSRVQFVTAASQISPNSQLA
jgi:hypothetical protein